MRKKLSLAGGFLGSVLSLTSLACDVKIPHIFSGQCSSAQNDDGWLYKEHFDNQFEFRKLPNGEIENTKIFPSTSRYEQASRSTTGDYSFEIIGDNETLFWHRFNFDKDNIALIHSPALPRMEEAIVYDGNCSNILQLKKLEHLSQ